MPVRCATGAYLSLPRTIYEQPTRHPHTVPLSPHDERAIWFGRDLLDTLSGGCTGLLCGWQYRSSSRRLVAILDAAGRESGLDIYSTDRRQTELSRRRPRQGFGPGSGTLFAAEYHQCAGDAELYLGPVNGSGSMPPSRGRPPFQALAQALGAITRIVS